MTQQEYIARLDSKTIVGQINVAYDLEQTLAQYMEIRKDLDENYQFDSEDFEEYVIDNVIELVINTRDNLDLMITLVTDSGIVINR